MPYPPVLGAHDEQRALREGAEGDALAVLAVDGLGLLLKHGGGVLGQTQQPSATSSLLPAPCQALLQVETPNPGSRFCSTPPPKQICRARGVPSGHFNPQVLQISAADLTASEADSQRQGDFSLADTILQEVSLKKTLICP